MVLYQICDFGADRKSNISHVGFQISTKNTNLVEDQPMNISGKFG
jgi:hypothetical protein